MNNKNNFKKNTNDKHINVEMKPSYGFYSRVLNKPFDSVEELKEAEDAHYAEIRAKENAVAQKKSDALKVEDAFKALNVARKSYKERLLALTEDYSESLKKLKAAFESDKAAVHAGLAEAENAYQVALKEFTNKYPEGYHITLKDGDFETTIERKTEGKPANEKASNVIRDLFDAFDMLYRF